MNEFIVKTLSTLENMIAIQGDSADYDDYMYGMMIGLQIAHSVVSNSSPVFHKRAKKKKPKTNIRHKIRSLRK